MESLGKHIVADFFACRADILNEVLSVENAMVEAARKSGAVIIDTSFHHFSPYGVSGVVVIQESHLAIHTWPEYRFASVDVFTCGDTVDPDIAFEALKTVFSANKIITSSHRRGGMHLFKKTPKLPLASTDASTCVAMQRNIWFTQKNEQFAISVKHSGKILEKKQSHFQEIELIDTQAFGKMLILDGVINMTEKDEFAHHEMLTHIPLNTHPHARHILILGGGDGCALRETLKHPQVESITLVERDAEIVRIAQRFLPDIARVFADRKLTLIFAEALQWLEQQSFYYDIVLVDIFDPLVQQNTYLVSEVFKRLKNVLRFGGLAVCPLGSPVFNQSMIQRQIKFLTKYFPTENIRSYISFVPTYPSGIWLYVMFSSNSTNFANKKDSEILLNLKYYNQAIHDAAFVLPNYIQSLVDDAINKR